MSCQVCKVGLSFPCSGRVDMRAKSRIAVIDRVYDGGYLSNTVVPTTEHSDNDHDNESP